jgi:hypothetical protein
MCEQSTEGRGDLIGHALVQAAQLRIAWRITDYQGPGVGVLGEKLQVGIDTRPQTRGGIPGRGDCGGHHLNQRFAIRRDHGAVKLRLGTEVVVEDRLGDAGFGANLGN